MDVLEKKIRKTFTDAQKTALLQAYQVSGQSKKQWCKESTLGLSTLQRWLREEKNRIHSKVIPNWIPVVTVPPESSHDLKVHMGKCTIRVNHHTDLQILSNVMKVLVEIC